MMEPDDSVLLAEFAASNSEAAFATLVSRYINLVYSTALRFTGKSHEAEEVTQVVFIIFARKAGRLRRDTIVSGWMYHTARLTAANLVRAEVRRQRREEEAQMDVSNNDERQVQSWDQLAPLLDEGLGRLSEPDRNALLLRYFENKTAAEVAVRLEVTEAAAHKRCQRALEKLRTFFTHRGVLLSAGAVAGAISNNSVQAAPAGLVTSITATAANASIMGGSTVILLKGVLKAMAWAKVKAIIMFSVGVALVTATGTVAFIAIQHAREQEEQRAYAGRTQMQLSGSAGAVVTGFYIQNGQRFELSNTLPWSFTGTNVSQFEFHKVNAEDKITVALTYDGNGAHARMTRVLNSEYVWLRGRVRHGFISESYPK